MGHNSDRISAKNNSYGNKEADIKVFNCFDVLIVITEVDKHNKFQTCRNTFPAMRQ